MKNLMLCMSGLLLATQLNAQQVNNVNVSTSVSSTNTVKNEVNVQYNMAYAYTSTGKDKNQTTVQYSSNAQEVQDDSPVKAKTFNKSFGVDRSDKINISNQFGSLTIKTWDKNEIKVDADIKAYAKTDEEAQKLLDQISITATKDGDLVTFRTNMGDRSGNWGTSIKNGRVIWRREAKVHMTVYMPASNALTASQTYGGINIDDFNGPTSLKVQYGNLLAGNLSNSNNYISVQYGKANIKDVNTATIKQQYGDGVTINSIGTIELETQYSAANIGTIKGNAQIKHQYGRGVTIGTIGGSLNLSAQYTAVNITSIKGNATISHQYGRGTTIGSVGALGVSAQYTDIKIGTLNGNLNAKVQYGKLSADEVENGNKDIQISSGYSDINLKFSSSYNGDLDVSTGYADFRYSGNVTARKLGDDKGYSSSKAYTGQVGKGGGAKINVRANYGSVTFR